MGSANQNWGRIAIRMAAIVSLAGVAGMGTGCKSYSTKSEGFIGAYQNGNYPEAAKLVTELTGTVDAPGKTLEEQAKPDRRDQLLFRLEQGAIYRATGEYERSNLAFSHATQLIQIFDDEAKIKLSQEGAALFTNLTALDYRGQMYDRVMASTYRAMNYLESGQIDRARPELIAAYERQQDAIAKYSDEIEKEKERALKDGKRASKDGAKADVDKTINDPQTQSKLSTAYSWVDSMAAYDSYVNPFSEYLQGLYFLHAAVDASDVERGRKSLEKVRGLVPSNHFVAADLEAAQKKANGVRPGPTTYVIFETGLAPYRDEIRIDLPIFIVNIAYRDTGVDYVGVAFPLLKKNDDFVRSLQVEAGGTSVATEVVADMDGIVAREFKEELPATITKTIAAAAAKAAAAYGVNKATQQNQYANLFARISTTVYQIAANQADLRTWRTLPKQFQVARIDTPADRLINIRLPNGASLPAITIKQGEINVVYVRSTSTRSSFVIQQYALH